MKQRSLTIAIPVLDQTRARRELTRIAQTTVLIDGIRQPSLFEHRDIHFARLLLIEEDASSPFGAWVVFESNFDMRESEPARSVEAHLSDLVRAKRDAWLPLLTCCAGFADTLSDAEIVSRLIALALPSTAEYQGHSERDLPRIALEARVRELCTEALTPIAAETRDPTLVYTSLRGAVIRAAGAQGLDLDLDKPAPVDPNPVVRSTKLRESLQPWVRQAPYALPLLPCLPYLLIRELIDRPYDLQREAENAGPASEAREADNARSEDNFAQNALSHLVAVKPGPMRRFGLRAAHRYLARLTLDHFNFVEQLGGIPSIHFAKWLLVDGGKRLLFLSNYDGSWESYLGDFVDQAAIGLNLAWSSTQGYPRTRALAFGGANDEERFKAWGRAHQRPTQVFYSAYPTLSVSNINNNTWLRHGLHARGPDDLDAFLRRLT